MDLETFIGSIPKAELHLQIKGTLEPELKFELAAKNGLRRGQPPGLAARGGTDA